MVTSSSEFYHAARNLWNASELRRQLRPGSNSICIWPLPCVLSSPIMKLEEITQGLPAAGLVKVRTTVASAMGEQIRACLNCLLIKKAVLVDLLNQHLPTKKIAMRLGRSENTVLYWERKYGLSPAFASCGNGRRTRSLDEMAEAMIQEPIVHRRRLKAKAVEYKGGRCILCGYGRCNAALEFHHLDRTTKAFGLSRKGIIRSWESIRKELDKCVLICANCHREVEAGVRSINQDASRC